MIVTGELSDAQRIRQAIRGADAVISALGAALDRKTKGTPVADGTRNIVAAMEAENVSRYIGLATPSVADEGDQPTLRARILPVVAGLLYSNALRELVGMTSAVVQSKLDWTIARITRPTTGSRKALCARAFSAATSWDRRCRGRTSPTSSSRSSATTRSRERHRQSVTSLNEREKP